MGQATYTFWGKEMHGDYIECDLIETTLDLEKDSIPDASEIKKSMLSMDVTSFRHRVNKYLSENRYVTQSDLIIALEINEDIFRNLYNRNSTENMKLKTRYLKPKRTEAYDL